MRSHSSRRQPRAGVGHFDDHLSIVAPRAQSERAAFGMASMALSTRFESARCSKSGSAAIGVKILVQFELAADRRASRRLQLRLKQLRHTSQKFVHLHRLQLRMRHLRKLAEAPDDRFQVRNLRQQGARTLAEDFVELFRALLPRPHQILHRELQREQRILQLVRQPPRQFAPRRHALGLHQSFFLRQQFRRSCD